MGKNRRRWKILELEVGGRLSQTPHPKAGGLDLTRSVSEHHRLGPNPRDQPCCGNPRSLPGNGPKE